MLVTTRAIVISAVKYGDNSLIARCFTERHGVQSYLLRGVLSARKGKLRKAHFLPLTQLEITAGHRGKGALEHIREARVYYPYATVHTDVVKNTIVLFLAEVLNQSVREEEQNAPMFRYIGEGLQWLDATGANPNFHILFLLGLTRFLGFYPDTTATHLPYFDLLEGGFSAHAGYGPVVYGETLDCFRRFVNTDFEELGQIRMTKQHRRELLDAMVTYFELHLTGFRKPRSLEVLHEVFGG
ncbi:DNA repair protein RecO [Sinomicrobium soli]|uniref:DNA repair protein RecO n=1 Tax=Sinomicrobium sp. N-1-3-6 TaxID=2219864 RepID=UPI000DCCD1DA|nr:DNA repair protein RecO [Sinomicrobium sp. N-1-3-6]RAV29513.1 DNA repair protein RecO [Sinomicrobium sp. N-1-3-6]